MVPQDRMWYCNIIIQRKVQNASFQFLCEFFLQMGKFLYHLFTYLFILTVIKIHNYLYMLTHTSTHVCIFYFEPFQFKLS